MDRQAYLLESLKIVKDWAIWVTGIQTAAVSVLAVLVKDPMPRSARRWALATLTSFVLSILAAVLLVLRLPTVVEEILELQGGKGIYDLSLYLFVSVRLGTVATIMHSLFIIGILCFATFVYSRTALVPSRNDSP